MNALERQIKNSKNFNIGFIKPARVLSGVLVGLLSVAVSLSLGEAVVRLYLYINREIIPTACRREDPILHHGLAKNTTCRFKTSEWDVTYKIDNLGLRDQEYSLQKPPGSYRILILGDSFAEGYGIKEEETYQHLLENKLNQSSNQLVEVINAGIQSYSPALEYIYLKKYGLSLQPDLIIVNLDLTDFSDEQRYQAYAQGGISTIITATTSADQWERAPLFAKPIPSVTWLPFIPTPVKWWLHQHSRLYDLSINTVKKRLHPEVFKDQIDFVPQDNNTDAFVILRPKDEAHYQKLWEPIRNHLQLINSLASNRHIPVVVMMHPHGHQISATEWSQGRKSWDFAAGKIYDTRPQTNLAAFIQSEQIPYLDLLPAFKSALDSKNPLFFPIDGHFTAKGHQVVANTLDSFLQQHRFRLE